MKLKETLTSEQRLNILNGNLSGIFPEMILPEDAFYSHGSEICFGYYNERSANKTISPAYMSFIDIEKEFGHDIDVASVRLGKYIRSKFLDKWNRIYSALITERYNALKNYEGLEIKNATNQDKDTFDTNIHKEGTDTDTLTFDTNVEDNGKTGSKEVTSRSVTDNNDVYGFNSVNPVGDSVSTEETTETVTGLANDNTTHNIETKTGTETKSLGINEDEAKTGTITKDSTVNENISKTIRDGSGAKLITEEIELRNKYLFFDIVYADIDSVATLQIYS